MHYIDVVDQPSPRRCPGSKHTYRRLRSRIMQIIPSFEVLREVFCEMPKRTAVGMVVIGKMERV